MKKLCFLFLFFYLQLYSQTGWIKLQNVPSTGRFKSVKFIDSKTGWIAGGINGRGVIISTTNGGISWMLQMTVSTPELNSIYFTDYYYGWTVGDSGIVLQTSNGGANWVKSSFITKTKQHLRTVFFIDKNNGWIAGDSGVVFKTTNNGLNWINCSVDSLYDINSIFFIDINNGWLVDSRAIRRTTNSGLNWFHNASITGLKSIFFTGTEYNTGWAVGEYYIPGLDIGRVYKTSDGGQNWIFNTYYYQNYFTSVYAIDTIAWVTSKYGDILKTTNGGISWIQKNFLGSSFWSINFTDSNHGWVVGSPGAVFKTTDGGIVFIEDETEQNNPISFKLEQNYPNPFNPSTKIRWQSSVSGWQTLKIYDILGNELVTLVNEEKPAGIHEVEFSFSDGLASGIYFYQLKAGEFVQTKKMMLLR